jgi:hypothetical protein
MDRLTTDPAIDRYLDRVRASLKGVPPAQVEEILLELRGHVTERSEADGDSAAALRSLGDPEDLARQYRADAVAARAECTWSPIAILHSLTLLRRGSAAGWAVLALTALGYAWAFALAGAAIEKLLSPRDVGLWSAPGGGSWPRLMVDGPGPPGARELLGWWIVPLALAGGALLLYTSRRFGLWWIRRARRHEH